MVKFKIFKYKFLTLTGCFLISCFFACLNDHSSDHDRKSSSRELLFYNGKGTGPVKLIALDSGIDSSMASEGKTIFLSKCVACHQLTEKRLVGPGLKGITKRRRPEWIMNQILDPLEMTKSDSLSKELLSIYLAQMTDMNLTQAQARSVLEFLREGEE